MATTYTPAASNSLADAMVINNLQDPTTYTSQLPLRADAKYFGYPITNEILALIRGRVADYTYMQTYTCLAGLAVGDPVYFSAANTLAKGDSTNTTKNKIVGWVRYKPTTTTCYIKHYHYVSGLSGLTAGGLVYLTDASSYSATAGTVSTPLGSAISTTEALLHADGTTAQGISGLLGLGSADQILRVPGGGGAATFGSIDLSKSAAVGTSILAGGNGGTNNAFFQVSGPAASIKTKTFSNASETVAELGQAQTFSATNKFLKDAAYTAQTSPLKAGSASSPTKVVEVGYDTGADIGYVQAADEGTTWKTLWLNPNAGLVAVGAGGIYTSGTFQLGNSDTVLNRDSAGVVRLSDASSVGVLMLDRTGIVSSKVPTQATTSTAGNTLTVKSSDAVAGSSVAGAAAGGNLNLTAGDAKQLTSGNANGGDIVLTPGAGVGTGTIGTVRIPSTSQYLISTDAGFARESTRIIRVTDGSTSGNLLLDSLSTLVKAKISPQGSSAIVGNNIGISASDAIAGSSVAGAAIGGSVTVNGGDAKRLTSGNADGGSVQLVPGQGIGTGVSGSISMGQKTDIVDGRNYVISGICDGRLTLTTANPVVDTSAGGTIYFTPYKGNRIAIYNGSKWKVYNFTELSLAITGRTANLPFDIFVFDNSGTLTLELLDWTNTTTRATGITLQDGVYCKSGATSRRYLGTAYPTAATTCDDTATRRGLWNYCNRVKRYMAYTDTTDSWTYTTATWRSVRALSSGSYLQYCVGLAEDAIWAVAKAVCNNSAGASTVATGVGIDSTSVNSAQTYGTVTPGAGLYAQHTAHYTGAPTGVGVHAINWLEIATAAGTTTWVGDNGGTLMQTGIVAEVMA